MTVLSPDVLIVGAGPAGSTLARLMAQRGWSATLIDRRTFPRPKACGEFVSPGSLRALKRTGLDIEPLGSAAGRIRGWVLETGGTARYLALSAVDQGLSLPRRSLDRYLLDAALRAGVDFRPGVSFRRSRWVDHQQAADVSGSLEGTVSARILVGAGGLRCPVASSLSPRARPPRTRKVSLTCRVQGVPWSPDRGRLWVRGPYTVGAAPSDQEGRRWNLTVVVPSRLFGRRVAEGPDAFFLEALRRSGAFADSAERSEAGTAGLEGLRILAGPWASGPFDRPVHRSYGEGVALVGDAAGYYDPFTGQGIYQAIRSAELIAPHLHRALAGDPFDSELARYDKRLRRERRRTVKVQRLVEFGLGTRRRQKLVGAALKIWATPFVSLIKVTADTATPLGAVRQLFTADAPRPTRDLYGPNPYTHPAAKRATS